MCVRAGVCVCVCVCGWGVMLDVGCWFECVCGGEGVGGCLGGWVWVRVWVWVWVWVWVCVGLVLWQSRDAGLTLVQCPVVNRIAVHESLY